MSEAQAKGVLVEVRVPADLWPRRGDWRGRIVSVKGVGERVARGEPVAEVEIEKAVLVIESPVDGVVVEVRAVPGSEVGPGDVILVVRREG